MKELLTTLLCIICIFTLTACTSASEKDILSTAPSAANPSNTEATEVTEETEDNVEDNTETTSPWIDCETLEDAAKIIGFEFHPAAFVQEYNGYYIGVAPRSKNFRANYREVDMIVDPENPNNYFKYDILRQVYFLKVPANDYSYKAAQYIDEYIEINGMRVEVFTEGDRISSVMWINDGYVYSADFDGVFDMDTVMAIVADTY